MHCVHQEDNLGDAQLQAVYKLANKDVELVAVPGCSVFSLPPCLRADDPLLFHLHAAQKSRSYPWVLQVAKGLLLWVEPGALK